MNAKGSEMQLLALSLSLLVLLNNVLHVTGSWEGSSSQTQAQTQTQTQAQAQTLPVYVREPRDVYATANGKKQVVLTCQVGLFAVSTKQQIRLKETQKLTISWLLNGSLIVPGRNGNSVAVSNAGDQSQLTIVSYRQANHQGRYQCSATFSNVTILSRPASVRTAYAVLADQTQTAAENNSSMVLTVGNTAFISCVSPFSVSVPRAEVIGFELNGAPLTLTPRHIVTTEGNLLIASVQQADQGSYRCKVANLPLNLTKFSPNFNYLRVIDPKKDIDGPAPRYYALRIPQSQISAVVGQNVTIECVFVGMPPPKTVWEFARPGESQVQVSQNADGRIAILSGALLITNVQPEDAGTYSCSSVDSRSVPHYSQLRVNKPPAFEPDVSNYQVVSARVGTRLELECGVSDATRFSWYHDGVLLLSSGQSASKFVVNALTPQNGGMYQCFAENTLGSLMRTIRVATTGSKAYQILQGPVNKSFSIDELAIFACVANGIVRDGVTSWSWLKDGELVLNESRITIEETNEMTSSLQIFNVKQSDAGSYTCVLTDLVGSRTARATAWLTVESVPSEDRTTTKTVPRRGKTSKRRPSTLSAAANGVTYSPLEFARTEIYIVVINSTSVSVSWTHAEPLLRWLHGTAVWYAPANASDAQTERKFVTADVSEYILSGLQPNTLYEVWVVAQQQNGDRATPSETVVVRTLPASTDTSDDGDISSEDDDGAEGDDEENEDGAAKGFDADDYFPDSITQLPVAFSGADSAGSTIATRERESSLSSGTEKAATTNDTTLVAVLVSATCGTLVLLGVIVALLLTRRRYKRTKAEDSDSRVLQSRSVDRNVTSYAKLPQQQQTATVNISPNRPTGPMQYASSSVDTPIDNAYVLQATLSRNANQMETFSYATEEPIEAVAYASAPIYVPSLVTKRESLVLQTTNSGGNAQIHLINNPYPQFASLSSNPNDGSHTHLYHTLMPPPPPPPPPQAHAQVPIQANVQPCNIVTFLSNIRPPSVTNSTVSSQPCHLPNVNALLRNSIGQLTTGTGTVTGSCADSVRSSRSASSVASSSDCDCSDDEHCHRSMPKNKSLRVDTSRAPQAYGTSTASRKRKHAKYRNSNNNNNNSHRKGEISHDTGVTMPHNAPYMSVNGGVLPAHLNI